MKLQSKTLFTLIALAVCVGLGAVSARAADVVVSNDIATSTTWTRDHTYILDGIIFLTDSATLTIEPGTVVRGKPDSETAGSNNPGTLVVARGAKIFANGTCEKPIVFTDMDDDNVPGGAKTNPLYNNNPNNMITENWGGVILLGSTYIANDTGSGPDPTREEQIEGITSEDGVFGGGDDDDSSGSMSYVSIRYGGYGLLENEEINGLTMGAVGRGTTLHHIEVVNNVDDGFEWFGGTVNSKYLITWNIGDDSFDTDRGYRGKSQFGLVVKGACKTGESSSGGGVANRAFEMDGGKDPDDSRPYALSQWRNYTLIGMGSGTTDPASDDDTGIEIRDNARPQIYQTIVMDMGADAVDIEDLDNPAIDSAAGWTTAYNSYPDDASFYPTQQQGMQTEIADCLFYNIGGDVDDGGIGVMDAGKQNTVLTTSPIQNVQRQAATGYSNIMVVSSLDPRPTAAAQGIQKALPTDGFFTPVDYYGAFGTDSNWAEGWSLIHAMGVLDFSGSGTDGDGGNLVTSDLWIKAVINTVEKGPIEAVWQKGGEDTTSRGDRVIWGHFYASPSDVTWGSQNNPDLFVKIWFDVSGRIDVNYFHVSVPDIEVYSDYPYDGTADEQGTTTMSRRYIRQYYEGGQSYSDENYEDGNPPSGYVPTGNPSGYSTINDLRIGSSINTVEKGPIDGVWRLGGQDTTARGDQVVWGHFYASPSDVTWGSQDNPDLFVKIWLDVSGRVDVNFFHVSVPDIEVSSDLPDEGVYDLQGTTIMDNRYIRHEYWR